MRPQQPRPRSLMGIVTMCNQTPPCFGWRSSWFKARNPGYTWSQFSAVFDHYRPTWIIMRLHERER
jgi:hypothetical protein